MAAVAAEGSPAAQLGGFDVLLFDLDGTLYPIENGFEAHVRGRIYQYMHERLGVETVDLAKKLWKVAFSEYNQSLRGLRAAGYRFDADDYWQFIRTDPNGLLKPDPAVRAFLESLPQPKYVVTNCREKEAQAALESLGLGGIFLGVFGADGMGDRCKPDEGVLRRALEFAGNPPASRVAFFEDSLKNLVAAKRVGMATVLVDGKTRAEEAAAAGGGGGGEAGIGSVDAVISACTAEAVKGVLPGLWVQPPPPR